ncbi:uncharacterized protein LOC114754357 [Neltuma alba]|uniref:uncharacterized protein LOC114754342 n=1 Tax=Neltuma alba TaxID=207710 RepID=UPI0010A52936|nr:uncharacterized protein LOC114754342 [Prosopis alba]XP_028798961.1 uncharacterized protein LOC114754357 [Prosopis alba]
MTAPNMETITASLERCSLNNHHTSPGSVSDAVGTDTSSTSNAAAAAAAPTLDLNSSISLPYHWEQCLDLKTGEIYYINWSNGMKAREDPRRIGEEDGGGGEYYYSEDESWHDSEESSSESCPSSSREHASPAVEKQNNVLVVAGCKSCLMYFMVPKQVEHCPRCSGQLLHFDRSDNASPSP